MSLSIAKRYPLSFKAAPPSPKPNLKSNIVTGLLLLLGEKGEKIIVKRKHAIYYRVCWNVKWNQTLKNIEIICLYQTKSWH